MIFIKSLSKKQTDFIIALMTRDTITQAHEQAGISQASAYKYLKDPIFKKAMSDMRTEAMRTVTQKLMNSGTDAVDALTTIMNDKTAAHTARVSAARAILEHLTKTFELSDIVERLEKLENSVGDKGRF